MVLGQVGKSHLLFLGQQQGLACMQRNRWRLQTTPRSPETTFTSVRHRRRALGTTESKINNTVADSITLTFLTLPLYFYCSGADASQGPCPDGVARSVPRAEWNQRVALRRSGAVVQPCWGIHSDCLIIMREGGLIQRGLLAHHGVKGQRTAAKQETGAPLPS